MNSGTVLLTVIGTSLLFGAAGLGYAWRRGTLSLDAYLTARGRIGVVAGVGTLFASAMGPWILFGPPEAATWGGAPTVLGYALGSTLPVAAFAVLGPAVRRRLPRGRSLTEYVGARYGSATRIAVGAIVIFYLGVSLTAQLTGIGFVLELVAGVPLSVSVGAVFLASLVYTLYGGLETSIFTDGLQALLIAGLLVALSLVLLGSGLGAGSGLSSEGGLSGGAGLDPRWKAPSGWRGGLALVLAISSASLFNQGTWQRVWAMEGTSTVRRSFLWAAPLSGLVVAACGTAGLWASALGRAEPPSAALFNLFAGASPLVGALVAGLGVALVMSSADTVLSALSSMIGSEVDLVRSDLSPSRRLRWSRWGLLVLAVPVGAVAVRGYSVLYLFLIADLVCAAAAYPVFAGLFDERHGSRSARGGMLAGLIVGAALFPGPARMSALWAPFAAAVGVSVCVSLALRPFEPSPTDPFGTPPPDSC